MTPYPPKNPITLGLTKHEISGSREHTDPVLLLDQSQPPHSRQHTHCVTQPLGSCPWWVLRVKDPLKLNLSQYHFKVGIIIWKMIPQ